jgi:hypothetical protein
MTTTTQQPDAPTPETDAQAYREPEWSTAVVVPVEFARKLERERDQWRECARRFWKAGGPNGCCIDIPALRGAIAEFERLKEAQ